MSIDDKSGDKYQFGVLVDKAMVVTMDTGMHDIEPLDVSGWEDDLTRCDYCDTLQVSITECTSCGAPR